MADSDTVLELGCGDGTFAFFLLKNKPSINYIATDISEKMLTKTGKICSKIGTIQLNTMVLDINDAQELEKLPIVDVCGF